MPNHITENTRVYFRQSNLPGQWMTLFWQLGIYVILTGSKRYPYAVELSETDFLSCMELARDL